ncbi:MAG: gamma-glutamyl-gamma-aminobutyrate hydrolase family protein [Halanaerobiales bacterium]
MKPLIGITNYYVSNGEMGEFRERTRGVTGQDMAMCTMDYLRGVQEGGGIPFGISVINNDEYIEDVVKRCDGILLSGGPDINPGVYNARPESRCGKIVQIRDEFEIKLIKKVLEYDKPLLGICRGAQLINLVYGGTLYQHIDDQQDNWYNHALTQFPRWYLAHEVELVKNTHLYNIFNKKILKTNSLHHQAIKEVGDGLKITARTKDGIVEGIEDEEKEFLLGVQWHPEMMYFKYEEQKEIFTYFIENIKDSI